MGGSGRRAPPQAGAQGSPALGLPDLRGRSGARPGDERRHHHCRDTEEAFPNAYPLPEPGLEPRCTPQKFHLGRSRHPCNKVKSGAGTRMLVCHEFENTRRAPATGWCVVSQAGVSCHKPTASRSEAPRVSSPDALRKASSHRDKTPNPEHLWCSFPFVFQLSTVGVPRLEASNGAGCSQLGTPRTPRTPDKSLPSSARALRPVWKRSHPR